MTLYEIKHEIAHLASAELQTPDPEGTLWFFKELLGMYETHRSGASVYLRGYEDPYLWSLKVTEGPVAKMVHAGMRVSSPEALERRAAVLAESGLPGGWMDGEFGYGHTYWFHTPDGHEMRLHWEVEHYHAHPTMQSKILTRPSKKPLQGIPVKRIDHLNLLAADVTPVKETFEQHLGMQTRERLVDGPVEHGAWLSSNLLAHELAIMRDGHGARGRMHHIAFFYGVQQHNFDAAEMFRDYNVMIEAGPDRHGLTQGAFLYVFEPGGHRVELFGDPGILEREPDFDTKTWTMEDIDTVTAIGGAGLPRETYFTYGTPPV
ncbi:VOC family protein [Lipingzhangella sp. LS1_29]|uniref:VOC family protein n=1 Tax=Lipingzhangella rawalii TaxID=2055835 RepID=A0ABU2HCK9_9ACTN|nr:VOC family protein [Lipingzhangella rawalii]MDS1272589.1 VOC family protein [Lipingzhangella rawalii]